ncbi:Bacteroidetes-specific putative membrane protein [Bacteroidales bacterium Barb6XT]|nr:Bacteroidetes-specific putative membrane protein [Bacteroidales bacterium Barb6XT]
MRGRLPVVIVIIGLFACAQGVRGQYDVQFSRYFETMGYYNPGIAGSTEDMNVTAAARVQWLGMEGAPMSFFGMADRPIQFGGREHGVGVLLFTERIGLFQNTHMAGQYAFKQKLFGGMLHIGLQAGLVSRSFDGAGVKIPDNEFFNPADDAIPKTAVSGMALDMNAGLYYTRKRFYVGAASTHITAPEVLLNENAYVKVDRAFNFTGGYNIETANPLLEVRPSAFLKTDLQTWQAEATLRVFYNKMFNGGVSWRMNESVILLLGGTFGRLQAGYAYDFPISAVRLASSGSHELVVRYSLKIDKTKTGKNKHKSVRIL